MAARKRPVGPPAMAGPSAAVHRNRPATGLAQVAANASTPAPSAQPARARLPATATAAPPRPARRPSPGARASSINTPTGPHWPPPAVTPSPRPARAAADRWRRDGARRPSSASRTPTRRPRGDPEVNGIRPITTLLMMPLANSQVATAPVCARRPRDPRTPHRRDAARTPTRAARRTGERGKQQRVAGHVVAAVPLRVPDATPGLPQPGPEACAAMSAVAGADDQDDDTGARSGHHRREGMASARRTRRTTIGAPANCSNEVGGHSTPARTERPERLPMPTRRKPRTAGPRDAAPSPSTSRRPGARPGAPPPSIASVSPRARSFA